MKAKENVKKVLTMAKRNAVSAVIQREVQRIVAQRTIERVQMCKDAAMIAANEALGMGEGRCVAFSQAFDKALNEIVHTCLEDTPDIEYTKEVIDRQLKAICGENFQPWESRYRH